MRQRALGTLLVIGAIVSACGSDSEQAPNGSGGQGGSAASSGAGGSSGAGNSGAGGSGNPATGGAGGSSGSAGASGSSGSGGASGSSGSGGASGSSGSGSGGAGGTPSSWPDETNTGIPAGACSGGLRAATQGDLRPASGAVVECVRYANDLPYIAQEVSNVTFRTCRFELGPTADGFVNVQGGNVKFEDCEFAGGAGTWIRASYNAAGLEVRRSDFSGMANAIEFGVSGLVIEDNYVHDFGDVSSDQHADGFQTDGTDLPSNTVIRHNTIFLDSVAGATAAIGIWASLGDLDDVLVENNLVAGGGYTIYPGVVSDGHTATNIRFLSNHFSTRFHPDCGAYGPKYPSALTPTLVWTGNIWHDGPNAGSSVD